MYQLIFRDWRVAALWVLGLSASVAAFFSEGGGQQKLADSAEQIRATKSATKDAAAAKASITLPAEPEQDSAVPVDDTGGEASFDAEPAERTVDPGEASAGEIVEG